MATIQCHLAGEGVSTRQAFPGGSVPALMDRNAFNRAYRENGAKRPGAGMSHRQLALRDYGASSMLGIILPREEGPSYLPKGGQAATAGSYASLG